MSQDVSAQGIKKKLKMAEEALPSCVSESIFHSTSSDKRFCKGLGFPAGLDQ